MCNKQLRHIYSFRSGEGYNKLVNYLKENFSIFTLIYTINHSTMHVGDLTNFVLNMQNKLYLYSNNKQPLCKRYVITTSIINGEESSIELYVLTVDNKYYTICTEKTKEVGKKNIEIEIYAFIRNMLSFGDDSFVNIDDDDSIVDEMLSLINKYKRV
jgi:hypothetical protein